MSRRKQKKQPKRAPKQPPKPVEPPCHATHEPPCERMTGQGWKECCVAHGFVAEWHASLRACSGCWLRRQNDRLDEFDAEGRARTLAEANERHLSKWRPLGE